MTFSVIRKCICIMGGRMQFAPTIMEYHPENPVNPDSKPSESR
jgi:hypothetical protein